jgi:ubiquitin carboxyl-terminal hydrolase 16/45
VLTLHLKRFQQDMRGRLQKIRGRIPFPADLDIHPFCDPKVLHPHACHFLTCGEHACL